MTIDSNAANVELAIEKHQPACKSAPPVDVLSDVRERLMVSPTDAAKKWWIWPAVTHVGDCVLQDEMLTIRDDGTANFFAHVKSGDAGDQWVFHGGISLLDKHGAVLWTSPKMIGPQMNFEDEWETWDEDFTFPVVWFDSAAGARINRAHC
jgi:Family of unknown function (DUF6294)